MIDRKIGDKPISFEVTIGKPAVSLLLGPAFIKSLIIYLIKFLITIRSISVTSFIQNVIFALP